MSERERYFYGAEVHRHLYACPDGAMERYRRRVRRELDLQGVPIDSLRGATVLDIGTGFQALVFAELGCSRVYHCDRDPGQVDQIRELCKARGAQTIHSYVADVTQDLGPAAEVNLAFVYGVLHHVAHPGRALLQILSRMTQGGTVLIRVYRAQSFSRFLTAHLRQFSPMTSTESVRWALSRLFPVGRDPQFEADLIDDLFVDAWGCFLPGQFEQDADRLGLGYHSVDGAGSWDFAGSDENFRVRLCVERAASAQLMDPPTLACARWVDPRGMPFPRASEIQLAAGRLRDSFALRSRREVAIELVSLYRFIRQHRSMDYFRLAELTPSSDSRGAKDLSERRVEALLDTLRSWSETGREEAA